MTKGCTLQHLVAWRDYTNQKHEISFWRTRSGVEVDFIVFGDLGFWAIEVKNSEKIRNEDLKGLISFGEDYPEAKTVLLYRGTERIMKKTILCIPCEEFIREIIPNQPLPIPLI